MTQSASKIVCSVLIGNCKKLCPPNSAFDRYQQAFQKDSYRINLDRKTYMDIKEELISMTADHTSRPDKVLFLPTHIFSHKQEQSKSPTCIRTNLFALHMLFSCSQLIY